MRGSIRRGMRKSGQELVVPVERPQVHELRPAGVGGIGDVAPAARAARQVPDDPAVDRAEQRLAAFGRGTYAVDVVEDPLQLRRREVGRRRQSGARAQQLARRFERGHRLIGARVLPDDGVVPRTAGPRIPHHGGFPLVGDADGREVRPGEPGGAQGAGDGLVDARGDLNRIVLDPSGAGQDLPVFELPPRDLAARRVEHHESACWWCPGRARRCNGSRRYGALSAARNAIRCRFQTRFNPLSGISHIAATVM